jgi:antiviral helicase SKI2
MILNLLRVEEMSVEGMIKRSFSEFATQRALTANEYPKLLARGQKTLVKLEEQFRNEASQRVGAEDVEEYFSTCTQLISSNGEILKYITSSADGSGDSVLQAGRILLVSAARKYGIVRTPALVLQIRPSQGASSMGDGSIGMESVICMVLLPESYIPNQEAGESKIPEAKIGGISFIGSAKHRYYAIYEIGLDQILLVSALKKKIEPSLLFKETTARSAQPVGHSHASAAFFGKPTGGGGFDNAFAGMKVRGKKNDDDSFIGKKKVGGVSSETQPIEDAVEYLIGAEDDEMKTGLALLDLRDSLKRGNDVVEFRKRCGLVEILVKRMRLYSSHRHPTLEKYYTLVERKHTLQKRVEALSHLLSNESLQLFPDFLQRKAVLRTLGYLDENETVCVKGRVACEVNTCEELIVTEMVFEGILNELEPAEIVAALSSLIYQQKSDDDDFDIEMPESLLNCCHRMKTIALNLGQMQKEHGLDVDPMEYSETTLKFGLVHVVYEWALGVPFSNICELTTAQEGSIVRCITRLDELCREVRNCARVVGNPTLYRKMEAASVAIKRDIVFASSLYVS